MQKVIITGASGFIGKALTKKLLDEGITVFAVVRNKLKLTDFAHYDNLKIIECEMNNYKTLNEKISNKNFDVFFHLAWDGMSGKDLSDYTKQISNILFTADAITAAKGLKAKKFVFTNSVNYYEVENYLVNRIYNVRPASIYGASKYFSEFINQILTEQDKIEYNSILLGKAFGIGDNSQTLPNFFITSLLKGECPDLVKGDYLYDWIFIDDVVDGIIAVAKNGKNRKMYYVGHRKIDLLKNILINVRNIIAPNIKLKLGTYKDIGYPDYNKIDLEACYMDTGFEAKADFKESILKTAEWIKNKDKSVVGG